MTSIKNNMESRGAIKRLRKKVAELQANSDRSRQTLIELGETQLDLAEHLARLKRLPQAADAFGTAAATLSAADKTARAARVRVRQASTLMVMNRAEEALAAVETVIDGGGRVESGSEVMPMAHLWRVIALKDLDRRDEALGKARRLVKRFGPGKTDAQRQIVARALVLESELALDVGDRTGARRAAEKILSGYGNDPSPSDSLQNSLTRAQESLAALDAQAEDGSEPLP